MNSDVSPHASDVSGQDIVSQGLYAWPAIRWPVRSSASTSTARGDGQSAQFVTVNTTVRARENTGDQYDLTDIVRAAGRCRRERGHSCNQQASVEVALMISALSSSQLSYADARCQFGTHPIRVNAGSAGRAGQILYQSLHIGPPDSWRVFGATWARLLAATAAGPAEVDRCIACRPRTSSVR